MICAKKNITIKNLLSWPLQGVTKDKYYLHKAQSLSAEQVVSYNRLEHITYHFVQISPRYPTTRIFRQADKSC